MRSSRTQAWWLDGKGCESMNENLDAPRARGGGPPTQSTETALQREQAVTIFERGAPGRRAFQCPDVDVPDVSLDELLPAHLRRTAPPRR